MDATAARVPADLARAPAARRARKKPVTVEVEFARAPGTLPTAEGPVRYARGDALLTGAAGERWPVPRARFDADYAPAAPGGDAGAARRYRKRPLDVHALCMAVPFSVALPGGRGTLAGRAGDWVVQYAPGDQAVVAADIFAATYELLDEAGTGGLAGGE